MDQSTYLIYFLLAALIFFGAKAAGRGKWHEEYTSLSQTKNLLGIAAVGVALHHMAQKTCAPWLNYSAIVHGLDPFLPIGYLLVGLFLFCSGLGLYKSLRTKPDYLKGFLRRRILPVVIAYYLSEFLYTAVRLILGQKMDWTEILWYLSGLHMANSNAWYAVVIPLFYLVFYLAFRFSKREGAAIAWIVLFTLAYTVGCAFIDHQDDWWIQGEWWYNTAALFPLGILFAKHEEKITRALKKGYWILLPLCIAGFALLFSRTETLINTSLGYYWSGPMKVPNRLMSAGLQWAVAALLTASCLLITMKVRIGNRALAFLGSLTLDFYLVHSLFVQLFRSSFFDAARSPAYIRNVPLYTAAVLAATVPAALLFRAARTGITGLFLPRKAGEQAPGAQSAKIPRKDRRAYAESFRTSPLRRFLVPAVTVLLLAGMYVALQSGMGNRRAITLKGYVFEAPEGFALQRSDNGSAQWKYQGTDKKVAALFLDAEIPDAGSRSQATLEELYADCDWLTEQEYYVNSGGIRMVRGFADYDGSPERRYYIENPEGLLVFRMIENPQYYSPEDCEAATLALAESVRPAR